MKRDLLLDFFNKGSPYALDPEQKFLCNAMGQQVATSSPSMTQGGGNPYNQNLQVRNLIVHGIPAQGVPPAVDMWQALNPPLPATVAPGTVLTCQLRNVGLIKRLLVKINFTVTAGSSHTSTLTPFGLANLISNITFFDLANNTRINSPGWHLIWLSSVKRRRPFGAAATTDTPFGFGNNFVVQKAASSISATNTAACQLILEVPFVRNDHDLRGAIYGDVTSATMQVQITLNNNMFVASTADPTLAMYQSGGTDLATISGVSWQVYQNYLDQLPRVGQNAAPVLPALDIGTAYQLVQTASALPVANQDNSLQFINLRRFLSTMIVYDNAGTLNAGTDLASIAVVSANFTNIRKVDPYIQALVGRVVLGDDMPTGSYYIDFNDRPIDTAQYGNMQILLNPSSVGGSTAVFLAAWEAYGVIGLMNQGGSIPSGA